MKNGKPITPRTLLWLLMGAWWVVNLLQAAFTGLANDEAYYYVFALDPAWGYFDHPPVTAWLVWLGTQFFGATDIGVRFFFTLLQPLYLLIFYQVVKPERETVRDVTLYFLITAALPILQLYGFLAVPDGPLLLASALFLLCYKRFTEHNGVWDAVLMGATIALLAYCKYHGALVVLFTLASNPRLLRNPKAYLAVAVAAAMMVPHLLWQADHDWVSFKYHLAGRNKVFKIGYVTEYLLNVLAVFNPLFFPLYVKAWRATRSRDHVQRAVRWIGAGLVLFFLLSSIRGYVQPQWTIVAAFMFVMLLFVYARDHVRTQRYVRTAALVTIGLVVLLRLVMIFNPMHVGTKLYYEIFDNKASYGAIADEAAGRPVIFRGSYAIAAKYIYCTGGEAYCQPNVYYRNSQWEFLENDTRMEGREVLVEVWENPERELTLANGRKFSYVTVRDFHPVRHVRIEATRPLPEVLYPGETVRLPLSVANPYPYDIPLSPDSVAVAAVWSRHAERWFTESTLPVQLDVPGHKLLYDTVAFPVPADLLPGRYSVGLVVRNPPLGYWYNSPVWHVQVGK